MQIFIHKTGIMQQMIRYLSVGYINHTNGVVHASKIAGLSKKLMSKYDTEIDKNRRTRRKKKGQGNAVYLCYPSRENVSFQFFLFLSPGTHFMRGCEKLKDATKKRQRVIFDECYEAIQLPRKGGINSWTWRLTSAAYADVRAEISEIIRVKKSKAALKDYIATMERRPGFRGVRTQVNLLRWEAIKEWNRVHKKGTAPTFVAPGGYVRHQKYPRIGLDMVVERMMAGKKPMAHSWRYTNDYTTAE